MSRSAGSIGANLVLFALICAVLQIGVWGSAFIEGVPEYAFIAIDIGAAIVAYTLAVLGAGYWFIRARPDWAARDRHLLAQGYAIVSFIVGTLVDVGLSISMTPSFIADFAAVFRDLNNEIALVSVPVAIVIVLIVVLAILACSYAYARLVLSLLSGSRAPNLQRGAQ